MKRTFAAFALAGIVLTGCEKPVDTQHVQEYAKTFAAAAPAFDELAGDFAQTCVRIREYSNTGTAFLRSRPIAEMTPAPNASDPPACALAASVSAQWKLR
ncbi:MAG TPA: hypothetical protein VGF18_08760, partial [Candidatus Tumulicola sp.]